MEFMKEGAEARLYLAEHNGRAALVKDRVPKDYRVRELDEAIRGQRTKREESLIRKAERIGVRVPAIFEVQGCKIVMEFLPGKTLKAELGEKKLFLCAKAGKIVGKLHEHNLVHGDLTTSNIIVNGKELVLIDFGLGTVSSKVEDKAVDLLNFKKTFEATHSEIFEKGWKSILKGYLESYPNRGVIEQIERVEKRVRYKGAM